MRWNKLSKYNLWSAVVLLLILTSSIVMAQDGTLRRIRVPILMYHYVGELPEEPDDIRVNLTLAPDVFRQHLAYLQGEGYTTISLYDLHDALENGAELPEKPIILTFDDGYIDHYGNVFPMLEEYGFKGTFFVVTDFLDRNLPGYMSWEQAQEIDRAGHFIEPHTKTHPNLEEKPLAYLTYQIMGSLESVDYFTSKASRMFSYPSGEYDENTLLFLETTPILNAVTVEFGARHTSDRPFELPRLRITNRTGVPGLIHLLEE